MAQLTVITAIHNQRAYNELFYQSLEDASEVPFTCIIVNNCSTDGSAEFFRSKGARVIDNDSNLPYSVAQNQGLEQVTSEYVAFLNNDIYLSKGWDRKLIGYLNSYALDLISPCGIENMESSQATHRAMRRWKWINSLQRLRSRLNIRTQKNNLQFLIWCMYGNWERFCTRRREQFRSFLYPGFAGNALVARTSLFKKIGKWNEQVASSDWDLSLRLTKRMVEKGDCTAPMVAGDVYVHHFIRATFRSARASGSDWNRLPSLKNTYPTPDLRYLEIPVLSVIIAVYNNAIALELLFISLKKQSLKNFEIVVADDGSGSHIQEMIRQWQGQFRYPIRHVWHEDKGFRKTIIVNEAVRRSRSGYLVFIDGDCILHHRFLERHRTRSKVGRVLSGRRVLLTEKFTPTIGPDDVESGRIEKQKFWWNGCKRSTRQYGAYIPAAFLFKNLLRTQYEILGSNFSLHKGDFFRINGYDERIIGRGIEDNNLCNRFKKAGTEILSVKHEALQYHLFHHSKPIPHKGKVIDIMGRPEKAWTPYGINPDTVSAPEDTA